MQLIVHNLAIVIQIGSAYQWRIKIDNDNNSNNSNNSDNSNNNDINNKNWDNDNNNYYYL